MGCYQSRICNMSLAETETNINNYYYCHYHFTAIASDVRPINSNKLPNNLITRMWANAQRNGRPAEYRWRPLFNAAKFG